MSAVRTIDFGTLGGPVFAGRPKGELARLRLGLDQLDVGPEPISVSFPEDTYSLNSSYFLGMFGPSVRRLGREGFLLQYRFVGPDFVLEAVEEGIVRALQEASPL